jgi:prepilin-type N-terminal cleavage/methylation domain-containing protein
MKKKQKLAPSESGFTMVELLIVIIIIAIIVTFSVMGIGRARASIRLNSSARTMINHLEKARIDSIRRNAKELAQMASVEVLNSKTYRVTMDFDSNGIIRTRDVAVEDGVSIVIPNDPDTGLPDRAKVLFNWRGKAPGGDNIVFSNGTTQATVNVTDSGDVSLNNNLTIPIQTPSNVNANHDIDSPTIVSPPSTGCVITTSVSSLSIRRGRSGIVRVTHSSAVGINAVTASATSILITASPESQSIIGNGRADFTILAGRRTGNSAVTFRSPCGAKTVGITITN